jgi:hypothetical protein
MLNHNHNDAFGKHVCINYSARSLLSLCYHRDKGEQSGGIYWPIESLLYAAMILIQLFGSGGLVGYALPFKRLIRHVFIDLT